MKEELIKYITKSLLSQKDTLIKDFNESKKIVGVRHCVIDKLFPDDIALQVYNSFPDYKEMRHLKSIRENKYTSKDYDRFNPILKDLTFAIQSEDVIKIIEEITGILEQEGDPELYAGGLSMMPKDCFLGPHIDNSHDRNRENYRTLNLLYYVTPGWEEDFGGNLELWDKKVNRKITIHSKFNRLVLMETNPWSWHSVSKVKSDSTRCCLSNYYFSNISPIGKEYFNVTGFSSGPGQPFKRFILKSDAFIRNTIRKIIPSGVGKVDIYKKQENTKK